MLNPNYSLSFLVSSMQKPQADAKEHYIFSLMTSLLKTLGFHFNNRIKKKKERNR